MLGVCSTTRDARFFMTEGLQSHGLRRPATVDGPKKQCLEQRARLAVSISATISELANNSLAEKVGKVTAPGAEGYKIFN